MSIDEFFGTNLVSNLANLLGIDASRIRIVDIVGASSSRRRRAADDGNLLIRIEIADPPAPTVPYQAEDVYTSNNTNNDSLTTIPEETTQAPPANYTG